MILIDSKLFLNGLKDVISDKKIKMLNCDMLNFSF